MMLYDGEDGKLKWLSERTITFDARTKDLTATIDGVPELIIGGKIEIVVKTDVFPNKDYADVYIWVNGTGNVWFKDSQVTLKFYHDVSSIRFRKEKLDCEVYLDKFTEAIQDFLNENIKIYGTEHVKFNTDKLLFVPVSYK